MTLGTWHLSAGELCAGRSGAGSQVSLQSERWLVRVLHMAEAGAGRCRAAFERVRGGAEAAGAPLHPGGATASRAHLSCRAGAAGGGEWRRAKAGLSRLCGTSPRPGSGPVQADWQCAPHGKRPHPSRPSRHPVSNTLDVRVGGSLARTDSTQTPVEAGPVQYVPRVHAD